MKNFLFKTKRNTDIRFLFAPIALFITGILFMSMTIEAQSALDTFMPNPNGPIFSTVIQPDGKILIGGDFTNVQGVARKNLARLNADGTLDNSFAPNPNTDIFAVALQPDGKILAGGTFTEISPIDGSVIIRTGIVRYNANGSADNAFDPKTDNTVSSIVVQPDGKIIAGGSFTSVSPNGGSAVMRNHIARFNTDGTLDATFDPNADSDITSMAIQPDGKILMVGGFHSFTPDGVNNYNRHHIARFNADGTLDATFDPGLDETALAVAVQTDGKILVGGFFNNILTNGSPTDARNRIARFNADGTLDAAFYPGASSGVHSIAVQPDGKIIIGGNFTSITPNGGTAVMRNRAARINMDGTLDTAFNPNVNGIVFSVAVQSDGKSFIGGAFNGTGTVPRDNFMRLEKSGLPDLWLNQNTNNVVYATAMQTDGKILVGGDFTTIGGTARSRLARLNADSTLDTMFNPNVNGAVYTIHIQTDGKILIGGDFTTVGGAPRNRIARLNANGTLDSSFNPGANNSVRTIAVQPDGKILVGGAFTNISGQARSYFARLTGYGSLDTTFYYSNLNNQINTIVLQTDGKILAGGDFTTINGFARGGIFRMLANGIADNTFNQTANGGVTTIALQTDGKMLIGGNFNSIGYVPRTRIARLNADGSVDMSFSASSSAAPGSIAVQSDGLILITGQFYNSSNYMTYYIVRLNANGSLDNSFNVPTNAPIRSITIQPDGKILVGGNFTSITYQSRSYFARLTNTAALSALDVYPTTLILTRDGTAAQFTRVVFEQSVDNGATWTMLGTATNSLTGTIVNDKNDAGLNPSAPVSTGYALTGQNIPTGQNVLIRARGYHRTGDKNGSETVEDKVQNVFLPAPAAGNYSVGGRILTSDGAGLRNALVQVTLGNGDVVTKRTSAFGYFQFDGIAAGQTVTISVTANNYGFSPQTVSVNDNVTDLIFTSD